MKHKKIEFYDAILTAVFIFGLVSDILNTFLFNNYIPSKIIEYFFWFSLGAYFGFNLLKWEINKKQD